jgi:DNA polymerase III gamma/tau subunit
MIDTDAAEGLQVINAAVDSGTDPRQFGQQVVEHLRAVLITQTAGDASIIEASPDERALFQQQARQFERNRLVRTIRAFNEAVNNFMGGWQPQLSLELALIESFQQPEVVVVQQAGQQPAQQAAQPTELPPIKQDASPAVQSAAINEKWERVMRALGRYSKSGPDVMRNFRVQRVEGNTVFLCVDNEAFFSMIHPYPDKRKAIERALGDVFKQQFVVQVVLVSTPEMEAIKSGAGSQSSPIDVSDSLLSTGIELGAEVKRIE